MKAEMPSCIVWAARQSISLFGSSMYSFSMSATIARRRRGDDGARWRPVLRLSLPPVSLGPMRKDSPVETRPDEAVIWTDGACSGNPGPGGWAAIVIPSEGAEPIELSGGERHTTNNRMELT